jgi:peptidoglycan/LPS O-acetylase OafA/YrhL
MADLSGLDTRDRLDGIEALRGFAANAIILFHIVWIAHVQMPSSIEIAKFHLGIGVQLFFVVSAFSLAYGYLGRLDTKERITGFYIRRLFRIMPLFYFMFFKQLLEAWFGWGVIYDATTLILNLTFLFNFSPRLLDGIVPASWSIGIEMLFYFIFPAFLMFAGRYVGAVLALLLSFLLASEWVAFMAVINGGAALHSFLSGLPFFCFGVLALHLYRSREPVPEICTGR